MPVTLTESDAFPAIIQAGADTEYATSATLALPSAGLANRTRWLLNRMTLKDIWLTAQPLAYDIWDEAYGVLISQVLGDSCVFMIPHIPGTVITAAKVYVTGQPGAHTALPANQGTARLIYREPAALSQITLTPVAETHDDAATIAAFEQTHVLGGVAGSGFTFSGLAEAMTDSKIHMIQVYAEYGADAEIQYHVTGAKITLAVP